MENEIIDGRDLSPTTLVEQNGRNNVNLNMEAGAKANFYFAGGADANQAEMMMAVDGFSKQYYQLIVTDESDVFRSGTVHMPANCSLLEDMVPAEIYTRCSHLSEEGRNELITFPAIVCNLNTGYHGLTDARQRAMYCYIKSIKAEGKNIRVEFGAIKSFLQAMMCGNEAADYFDLIMDCDLTDLNRVSWSVHKKNLFEAFDAVGLESMPKPQ